jgi:hypothetical protein
LYGRFWLSTKKSRRKIALLYLTEAILAYERWGATEKARLLSEECARLTINEPTTAIYTMDPPTRSTSASVLTNTQKTFSAVTSLDLETIVQASQMICNEVFSNILIFCC